MNEKRGTNHEERGTRNEVRKKRIALLIALVATCCAVFSQTLYALIKTGMSSPTFSHIPVIPLVSLFFVAQNRKKLFSTDKSSSSTLGFLLTLFSFIALGCTYLLPDLSALGYLLELRMLLFISSIYGSYITIFGTRDLIRNPFPFLFLLFMIPIPSFLLDRIVTFLLKGSSELVNIFFQTAGTIYFREGDLFHFPHFTIEIASQCSGIRSSIALMLASVIAGHMFLRSIWSKIICILLVIPFTIIKNAIRITSLTYLSIYFDISFLSESWLHRSGGIVFFGLTLLLISPVLYLLIRLDRRAGL